ncbi:MAG TPA: GDSL-type esterase/lipase family protein [Thermoguttaceae bacterium]|nr:GDSL-type esterase/lipase family protein [Thermoguttaceae bacterium]
MRNQSITVFRVACLLAACSGFLPPEACPATAPDSAGQSGFTIRTEPGHAMVPRGGRIDVRVKVLDGSGDPASGNLTVQTGGADARDVTTDLSLDHSGAATYAFHASPEMETGIHAVKLRHGPSGAAHSFYVDLLDRATYDAFDKVVDRIELEPLPAHVLFIGDSLTDQLRGQNYVDKVGFWLGKRYGPNATVKNVGVGGDYILRVWGRLNGEPSTYRLSMYDGIFEPVPTRVFFFLGHNDSKLTSGSNYATPVVLPGEFDQKYRLAIRKVKDETGAKITVISATSSVYEITEATAAKRRADGKAHNLFGKPEALEQFNAIARKVADECGAAYLDVYEPTRRHADKPSLFTRDGVHVSNQGHRLLALAILKHLAGE